MWQIGFFFHEVAFGLFSVFFTLYIISIGGSLLSIGVMSSTALLLSIPASFFWGYVCDKTKHYKFYILVSFLSCSIILYLLTTTSSILILIALYVIMDVLHVAHEPSKNILIAELYSREEWEKSYAIYEGLTEIGWLTGLLSGVFLSFFEFSTKTILMICSGLNFLAFLTSIILITDPFLVFERTFLRIERVADLTYRGIAIAARTLDGFSTNKELMEGNIYAFCGGLVLFSLATSTLFTPLPIFLSKDLSLSTSMVFTIYVLNSSGGVIGYFLASSRARYQEGRMIILKTTLLRSILIFILEVLIVVNIYTVISTSLILALMGFAYALYHICVLSLSMEIIPQGKVGLFNVFIGLGQAIGAYLGPFIAQNYGFIHLFPLVAIIFLLAHVSFRFSP
ncbi:MAG: MFS transporter [Candidatus Methanomethylicia archaeon]